jgi:ribose transport system ATP-binding protein
MDEKKENGLVLKIEGVNKTFISTRANVDINLEIIKGEVHGLIGENGSGKSTLASMISGTRQPDSGKMYFFGEEYAPQSVLEGRKKGVAIIYQEMGTVSGLTVAENIFLGKEDKFKKFGLIDRAKMISESKKILDQIGATHIDPTISINKISFEDRKLIEVAMAIYNDPQLIILDESTTTLTMRGRDLMYKIIDKMKAAEKTVIFITHDLGEVREVCDRATVLRDGYIIQTLEKNELQENTMRQLMIGRELTGHYYRPDFNCTHQDEVALKVENITLGEVLKNVSLTLHKGEILGIGGLTDCGMHELCKVIFGVTKPDAGTVELGDGVQITKASEAARNKMGYCPKNRDTEAIMLGGSVKENIVLMSMDKLKKGPIITRKSEKNLAAKMVEALDIKAASLDQLCKFLSGGNKQKVVVTKWLANNSEVLIMDCPTRGIDVGVKAAIYRLMTELKNSGKSILMISEELPELLGMSDNVIIMKDGAITGTFERCETLTESVVIEKMI